MKDFQSEGLSHDPIHGYIPFTSPRDCRKAKPASGRYSTTPGCNACGRSTSCRPPGGSFPRPSIRGFSTFGRDASGEPGGGDALRQPPRSLPGRAQPRLHRIADAAGRLLHDVGHGPFGHFFDAHYLADYGLNHEILGGEIIRRDWPPIRRIRRNPNSRLADGETLDPEQIVLLITRPQDRRSGRHSAMAPLPAQPVQRAVHGRQHGLRAPRRLHVGLQRRAFDLARLLHYSFFTRGLTIHERGLSALVRFISVRAELFRAIYFHRTVRAIDLELQELFRDSKHRLFPGDPREHLDEYRRLTEWSLLVEVSRWPDSPDPELKALGGRWREFLARRLRWKMACERTVFFAPGESERGSVLANAAAFEAAVRRRTAAGTEGPAA